MIIWATILTSSCYSTAKDIEFLPGRQVGTVQTELIAEASGIVSSYKNPSVLWVHNDSGDSAKIYAINSKGELLGKYTIEKSRCRDWEDIALGPGPDSQQQYLYIGDIGDNKAKYPSITVYRVSEPKVDPKPAVVETKIGPAESIELTYPDGPKDAETLMIDPLSGDIYIIAKREFFCRVYRAGYPQSTTSSTEMKLVATLPLGFAVAGDVSPDGRLIIVRGMFNAALWVRPEGKELWQAFSGEKYPLELKQEPQGEGICFDAEGLGYFTIGEMRHPPIYYFARSREPEASGNKLEP